jgi:hypothetical protein
VFHIIFKKNGMQLEVMAQMTASGFERTREQKKGCVERIAPRCTLSQNGYGNNDTC